MNVNNPWKELLNTLSKTDEKSEHCLSLYDTVVVCSIPNNFWELGYDGGFSFGRNLYEGACFVESMDSKYSYLWVAIVFLREAIIECNSGKTLQQQIDTMKNGQKKLREFCKEYFKSKTNSDNTDVTEL